MSKHVCLLSEWDADQFVALGIIPDCREHRHLKQAEAVEMVDGVGPYPRPVADWVGNGSRRVRLLVEFDLKKCCTHSGHVVMNRLIYKGHRTFGKRGRR